MDPPRSFDLVETQLDKLSLVRVLRAHPEWSLLEVLQEIETGGPRSAAPAQLTIRDLWMDPGGQSLKLPIDHGPLIDIERLERAEQSRGAAFDELVLEVLKEADREVPSGYVRARAGGPRWKVQGSLRRLEAAGKVVRSGATSSTRHRATDEES